MTHWLDTAVFYEIYPQSFMDSNADGIGDFNGIIGKLPYLQDLGCNAIWMNPCFDSSFYDAGYDVRDYYTAAPRYGTNEDLRRLFEEVHRRGMHILLDLVAGHTAIDHPWFAQSSLDEDTPMKDRYIWRDFGTGPRNKTYGSIASFLSGFSERPGMAAINCFTSQPALNYGFGEVTESWQFAADSPEAESTRLLLQDIMSFWLDLGCDGFRVDMAASLVKEDPDQRCTIRLWQKIRTFLDEQYPEAVLVSEWGDPGRALEAGFHMDFLLHVGPTHYMDLFRTTPFFSASACGSLAEFVANYSDMYQRTKDQGLICIPSGNHDMVRMRETLTPGEMKLAFAFLLTMPGCPFIYYGDEIGMSYRHGLKSKEGGYDRTGSRTPMQWSRRANGGFSSASPEKLYLPVDTSDERVSVEEQLADPDSLLQHVRALIHMRAVHSALESNAGFSFLSDGSSSPLVYERSCDAERLVVALNPSGESVKVTLSGADRIVFSHGEAVLTKEELILAGGSYAIVNMI